MHRTFIRIAAILGALSVTGGAFGAHALKSLLTEKALLTYETAIRYQFYHVFALLVVGVMYRDYANKWMLLAGKCFTLGIFIFCGSLYLLTLMTTLNKPGFEWLGAITPIGGICFIIGWGALFVSVLKKN